MPAFVLNNENTVTAHGFAILNAGGNFDRFRENPVMLDSHQNTSVMSVIGRWANLAINGASLQADPEFDMDDPDAAKIAGKVDRGFVKGASMGIIINDAEMREIVGMGYIPVVTKWELLEASPVGVPSNKAALRLYTSDGKTILKADEIKLSLESILNQKPKHVEKITLSVEAAKVLNISKDPEVADLNAAIMELSATALASKAAQEKAENDLKVHLAKQADELVTLAVTEGKITAGKKESFVKLATSDYKQAKDLLDALPGKQTFSDRTKPAGSGKAPADREGWDYMRYLKEAPAELTAMQTADPERFATLKANYKSKY